ncbi:ribbon-helix-helix protein, CopG family [Bittarella massiliensis (ex Durand et al. 2017)]|uniref:ribbon-helix-helix protein, CopG family n=1 Tax=Bittarella massiliensis (ex Durand et al. 2017) TaxID=1720313 RepID=UPI0034A06B5F
MDAIEDKFIVTPKKREPKEDKSVIMTLRLERELQEAFDRLAATSGRSRNEVMCMALRYALERLELAPEMEDMGEAGAKKD